MPNGDLRTDTETSLRVGDTSLREARIAFRSQSLQQTQNALAGLIAVHQILLLKLEVFQRLLGISDEQMKELVEELVHDERFAPDISELVAFYKAQQGVSLQRITNSDKRETGTSNIVDASRQPYLPTFEAEVGSIHG